MESKIFPVILEFCGGAKTDVLYDDLTAWNPGYKVNVLDNCSPYNRSRRVTHQNSSNSYIGGGIRDCLQLADRAEYILFIANDIEPVTPISIEYLQDLIQTDETLVQVGVSLTLDSDKVSVYPWMASRGRGDERTVPHCDLLCCVLRLDFIRAFGGFPNSKSGWGYDWEIAYQAKLCGRRIIVTDKCAVRHSGDASRLEHALGRDFNRLSELKDIYGPRYGDFSEIMTKIFLPHRREVDPRVQKHQAQQKALQLGAAIQLRTTPTDSVLRGREAFQQLFIRMRRNLAVQFHDLFYSSGLFGGTWYRTFWLGVPVQRCPFDLWVYQEIIHELKPDTIIETGTSLGGCALFLASMCDLVDHGMVVTIDIRQITDRPHHQRIRYLTGSCLSEEIVEQVRQLISNQDSVMVILDSDHHKEHVLREMAIYSRFVSRGNYLVVEATNRNGHPVLPDFGPGPMEAVQEFLTRNSNFIGDQEKEKFILTFNPKGYLRKVA
jgi:cephalosporin hydroxylase